MTLREQAREAVNTARKMLESGEALTPLRLMILNATLEHAENCIEGIQEVKYQRRAREAAAPAEGSGEAQGA